MLHSNSPYFPLLANAQIIFSSRNTNPLNSSHASQHSIQHHHPRDSRRRSCQQHLGRHVRRFPRGTRGDSTNHTGLHSHVRLEFVHSGLADCSRAELAFAKEIWGRVLAMGLIGNTLSITAQFQGTHLAGAALGSLITTASPLVTVALSAMFGLEKIPLKAWIGLGLGLLGVYALSATSGSSGASLAGILWLVLAAVSWGVLGLIGGQAVAKHDALLVTAWASAIACVTTAFFVPWETSSNPIGTITPGVIAGIAYIGIVSTAIAFSAWVFGVSRAGSVLSGIAFFAQPVVGGLLGWALLGENSGQCLGWQRDCCLRAGASPTRKSR